MKVQEDKRRSSTYLQSVVAVIDGYQTRVYVCASGVTRSAVCEWGRTQRCGNVARNSLLICVLYVLYKSNYCIIL